ncbi:MAG: Ltp family lipoprotein [Candidatus Levybacteria bacterium]|nr:Ltp family lipoprotein [Candidatus Levybacteria bacterium]
MLTGALGLIMFFMFVGAMGSGNKSSNSTTNSSTVDSTSSKTEPTATSVSKEPDVPTEYKSALKKATTYANTMHMSKKGVYNQLVSEYGEKFSPEAAQYAIDNVKADWNANALAKAKTYQDTMSMSPASIRSQLISDYGEKFTEAEADYAIQHLND